jgi:hypothetical protein
LESIAHPGWHILITEPRRERTAAANLTGRGIKVYCPELPPKRKQVRGKIVQIVQMMVPGYLFTPAINPDWGRIRATVGVMVSRPWLTIEGTPALVSHAVMTRLQEEEQRQWQKRLGRRYRLGDAVRVTDPASPFVDLEGEIERLGDRNLYRALMPLFNGRVPVMLREDQIEAA